MYKICFRLVIYLNTEPENTSHIAINEVGFVQSVIKAGYLEANSNTLTY